MPLTTKHFKITDRQNDSCVVRELAEAPARPGYTTEPCMFIVLNNAPPSTRQADGSARSELM